MRSVTSNAFLGTAATSKQCLTGVSCPAARCAGQAQVIELDWHAAPLSTLRALAAPPPDHVIAADCLYVDPAGSTPDARAFIGVCAALSGPGTRCYVALEARSSDVMQAFFSCAAAAGFHLVRSKLWPEDTGVLAFF